MKMKKSLVLFNSMTCLDDIGFGDFFVYEKKADADIYMKICNGVINESYNVVHLGTGILFNAHSGTEVFPLTKVEIKGVIGNGG